MVKNITNGSNLVKIGHFWWKWSKLGHFGIILGSKFRHMSKFWESGPKILFLNVSKNYFRFMDINVVKIVINWVNLVKMGHFLWKWSKLGHFCIIWGSKCRHMSKFWESGPIMLSLKVSKNYFSQVYGQKCGKNVINGFNLVKLGHFWWKWSKSGNFGIFWDQNDVIVQNLAKEVKLFFP